MEYIIMTDEEIRMIIKHYQSEYKYCREKYKCVDDYLKYLKEEMRRLSMIIGECYQCGNVRDFVTFYQTENGKHMVGVRCFHCNEILEKKEDNNGLFQN